MFKHRGQGPHNTLPLHVQKSHRQEHGRCLHTNAVEVPRKEALLRTVNRWRHSRWFVENGMCLTRHVKHFSLPSAEMRSVYLFPAPTKLCLWILDIMNAIFNKCISPSNDRGYYCSCLHNMQWIWTSTHSSFSLLFPFRKTRKKGFASSILNCAALWKSTILHALFEKMFTSEALQASLPSSVFQPSVFTAAN